MKGLYRSGSYHRVYKPDWADPLDTKSSMEHGGRWNAARSFGVLYLNATVVVAAANARRQHARRAIGLFDLKPDRRPQLLTLDVPRHLHLNVVTTDGLIALNLPLTYPWHVGHTRCHPIGKQAYNETRFRGVAARSAAECTATEWLGEELAWFDRSPALVIINRQTFDQWYPDIQPA